MSNSPLEIRERIYFDNSATTKVAPEVVEAMLPFLTEEFGNASSLHIFGQRAKAALERSRLQVAALLGAEMSEIVFVSGGTEADNLAIRGIAAANSDKGRHIITSQFEHPAVGNTCAALEKQGWHITYLPVYENGLVRLEDLRAAIREETVLITIMHANNEVGTIQPIAEMGELIKQVRGKRKYPFFIQMRFRLWVKYPLMLKSLALICSPSLGIRFMLLKG